VSFAPRIPADYIEFDDPVYGLYAQSWYCSQCLRELGADLSDPTGEVPGCPHCETNEHIAVCEWRDVVDHRGRPTEPGPLADRTHPPSTAAHV
jgi:hypothetical protein